MEEHYPRMNLSELLQIPLVSDMPAKPAIACDENLADTTILLPKYTKRSCYNQ
jgi:hypothetical protein